jgi:hypothetical protein
MSKVGSDERLQSMQKMLDDGDVASVVGAAHGVSKNVVIGLIHRGKLRRLGGAAIPGRKPAPEKVKKPKPSPARRAARPVDPELDDEPLAVEAFIPRAESFRPVEPGEGVAIRNIREGLCKWPLGTFDEVSKRFCGDPTGDIKKVYCTAHHKLAYIPMAVSQRQRAAWKKRLATAGGARR